MSNQERLNKEAEIETSEVDSRAEVFSEAEPEERHEVKKESPEEVRREIEKLGEEIYSAEKELPEKQESPESRAQKIEEYQKKYLPDYLRDKKGFVAKAITGLWTRMSGKCEKEGNENLPEKGPFIVICNHFGGGEPESLLKTFKNTDLHFAVAKEIWWNSSPINRWFLKKFGTIPMEESLSNLTEEQKEEALKNQGKQGQTVFRRIIDREKQGGVAMNTEFMRQAVALLSRGDAVGIFPEGLWLNPEGPMKLREKQEMKKAYGGLELVASLYQKLTGEELPIIPTAFIEDRKTGKKKVVAGEPIILSKNNTELSDTDWAMTHVAKMLPEEQRGYYRDKTKNIEK